MTNRALIAAAARTIAPFIRTTPVLALPPREAAALGAPGGLARKLELLQHAGSFKPRGAFNRMLSATLPPAGVATASGGNHGAAVAYAARALGVKAEVFCPVGTPAAKTGRIESYGARLHKVGAMYDEAREASEARAAETGALIVHAYDQPEVLAGQGTVGKELAEDAPEATPPTGQGTGRPSFSAVASVGQPSGSTLITCTPLPANQAAIPPISPPPPTATSSTSRSGDWSSHSRASVPCPASVSNWS